MTVATQSPNPRRLETPQLVDVLQAARHTHGFVTGDGATAAVGRAGIAFAVDEATIDQSQIRQSFFAEIAPRGPGPNPLRKPFNAHDPGNPGEPDFADSRYWVREVADMSGRAPGLDFGLHFRRYDMLRHTLFEKEIASDPDKLFRFRWFPAVNVSEIGPGGDAHALPVGTIVRVFAGTNPAGRLFYWFAHPVGSATRFGVVRDTFEASTQHDIVIVQRVKALPFQPPQLLTQFEFETDTAGNPVTGPVAVWPNLRAAHYEGFRYGGETMQPRVQPLPVVRIDGVWYVQQMPRWRIHKLPISARITDCSLVSFVAGLFGRRG